MIADREYCGEQVEMVADQSLDALTAHQVCDESPDIAALSDIALVAEPAHQLRPRASGAGGVPTKFFRLARESVARQWRHHEMECVIRGAAVSGRVGQRADCLEQLDHRARPAMRH